MTSGLLSVFGYYTERCYDYSYIKVFVDVCFHFSVGWETLTEFSKVFVLHAILLLAMYENSSPTFGAYLLCFSQSNGHVVLSHSDFNFIG